MPDMKDWKWIDLPETGSTNDEARKYSAVAGGGKFVITAVRQNNGRGRRGRSWVGMEGNLFMSLGIEVPLAWPGQLIFIVTLALAQSILKLSPAEDVRIKWPNDVLVRGCKISGILLEKGEGGYVIAEGTIPAIEKNPVSQIGPFLSGAAETKLRRCAGKEELFANGVIHLSTAPIHTVKPLEVRIPKGRLTVVTGVSGSGKTTMVLESLVPALDAHIGGKTLPEHIRAIDAEGIAHIKLIDAAPIGINVRSTVATYAGIHDELRRLYAQSADAKERGYKASDFSYNTGALRCPGCDGTGVVSLDVQFLPDVNIPCPDCRGSRYARKAYDVKLTNKAGASASLPELMDMDVNSAMEFCKDRKAVRQKLGILRQLGLGYLTLGEETPSLSGGEAQRLKLASEIGKTQTDSVFVFDEPSIGLHPLDVRVLLGVFQALLDNGATVIVIEHDLDVIRNADYVIDMGPGGGESGGRVVAVGTPQEIAANPDSITGRYL